jgi:hypothetical protein
MTHYTPSNPDMTTPDGLVAIRTGKPKWSLRILMTSVWPRVLAIKPITLSGYVLFSMAGQFAVVHNATAVEPAALCVKTERQRDILEI